MTPLPGCQQHPRDSGNNGPGERPHDQQDHKNAQRQQQQVFQPLARELERELAGQVKPSRTVELLSPFPLPTTWALAASGQERTRRQALRYLRRWRSLKPALDGHALLAMGAKPGPRLGEVLRHLKAAKLDGEVRSRGDEERMARRLLGLSSDRRE